LVKVDDLGVTEPAAAGESAPAVTQSIPVATGERCAQCAAPLAPDQRYCLQCGAPRPHLSGPISGGRPGGPPPHVAASPQTATSPGGPQTPPPGVAGGPPAGQSGVPLAPPPQPASRSNNTLALLAGVGVLLLAMGVGVLIGRASSGSAKVPPAQVISVGGSAAGASTTATTPTTTTPTTETPAAGSAGKASKAKAATSPGSGSSIAKPAPPTVLNSVSKKQSGSSYEQKSKNLPNVVETG
jgi:hypothetical protein